MSVNLPVRAKAAKPANRYYKEQAKHKEGENMAYRLGTKILVDSLELIDSGVINLFCGEFKIIVADLIFHFKITEDRKKSKGNILVIPDRNNGKNICIELCNFSSPDIQGYFEPIKVGHVNERSLFINFSLWVADKNRNAGTVAYNIYLGEKPNA
jgi:hypothetical protein